MKNDALKKHHFWILALAAPLMVFLAVVFLLMKVSGSISDAKTKTDAALTEVKGGKAPGTGVLKDIEKKKESLEQIRGELWKKNWDKQAVLFTWPKNVTGTFDKYNDMKFGATFRDFIGDASLIESFKPAYDATYTQLSETIAPTKYRGGWQAILRKVDRWGNQSPESKQMWVVMEDVWIQRAMLDPIKKVNESLTAFTMLAQPGQKSPPLKRSFTSRTWKVDLEVGLPKTEQGGQTTGRVLMGKLENRTDQLQVLGLGSAMVLKVWFDPKLDLPPFEFRIEGAGVAGKEAIEIPPLPTHAIPPNVDVVEIAKIEQVLDDRTVPIRRLDRLAMGYFSSKDASKELVAGGFWPEDPAIVDLAAIPGGQPGGQPGGDGPGDGRGIPGGGQPVAALSARGIAGPLPLMVAADANKKRYVEVTSQLRRMPVAFTVVVDQMYATDVLVAYANSPMRFETTQVHWKRFLETLNSTAPNDGSPGGLPGADGDVTSITGNAGAGLSGGGYPGGGPGSIGIPGGIPGLGSPGGSDGGNFGGIPGLDSGSLSSVSDAQANSGLIQLTVYGLITLYERYEAPKKEAEAAPPMNGEPVPATEAKPMDIEPAKTEPANK